MILILIMILVSVLTLMIVIIMMISLLITEFLSELIPADPDLQDFALISVSSDRNNPRTETFWSSWSREFRGNMQKI